MKEHAKGAHGLLNPEHVGLTVEITLYSVAVCLPLCFRSHRRQLSPVSHASSQSTENRHFFICPLRSWSLRRRRIGYVVDLSQQSASRAIAGDTRTCTKNTTSTEKQVQSILYDYLVPCTVSVRVNVPCMYSKVQQQQLSPPSNKNLNERGVTQMDECPNDRYHRSHYYHLGQGVRG